VSKLLQIIGLIAFSMGGGYLSLNTLVWGEPLTHDHEIWRQETRNIAVSCGAKYVLTSWTVRRGPRAWRTDRQTEPAL